MKWPVCMIIGLLASPAMANTYHAGSDCKPLETYAPTPDIDARAGYDAKGNTVVPPDLHASPLDVEALKQPTIGLDIPVEGYVKPDSYNADLRRSDIHVGQLKMGPQGEVKLNDQILSTGQQSVYPKGCE